MTPEVISALSGTVTAIVTLVTAYIFIRQVREMQRATYATAFKAVYDMLQSDTCRADRGFVMSELDEKPFDQWTPDTNLRSSIKDVMMKKMKKRDDANEANPSREELRKIK